MNPGNQIPASADYKISKASLGDVAGILSIIRPLEKTGALVKRSKERMEEDIEFFLVAKKRSQSLVAAQSFTTGIWPN